MTQDRGHRKQGKQAVPSPGTQRRGLRLSCSHLPCSTLVTSFNTQKKRKQVIKINQQKGQTKSSLLPLPPPGQWIPWVGGQV